MPRGPRLDAQGIVHHVMARGIEGSRIFYTDEDREGFLDRLELVTRGDKAFVYAWSLIPNHFHLAIRTGSARLSTVMCRLMTGYAVSFNRRYQRQGHLFQNRFKSIVVDDEPYLLGLVRYIHLNPLRAGLVRSVTALARYPWTGHATLMGNVERAFQDTDEILVRFGRRVGNARNQLVEFMSDLKAAKGEERLFKGGGLIRSAGGIGQVLRRSKDEREMYDERILGDGQFVQAMLEKSGIECQPILLNDSKRETQLGSLLNKVCERYMTTPESVRAGNRTSRASKARNLVAFAAERYLGWSGKNLAGKLGVSPSVISRCIRKGEREAADNGLIMKEFFL